MRHRKLTNVVREEFLSRWLKQTENASNRWLGKACVWAAWIGLLLGATTPPHGTGLTVCFLKAATGIPCPGCGLTRSLSCGMRGMFLESWHYHPMGLIILALFFATAATTLMPSLRTRLAQYIDSRPKMFDSVYVAFVFAFVSFGLLRALVHLTQVSLTQWPGF